MATKTTKKPVTNHSPVPATEVMTLAEAAAFLRVSEDGLKADAAAGRVPGRHVAGEWRFVKETLLAWLSQPEPRPARMSSDLVEHLKRTGQPWTPDAQREAEAFISSMRSARKAGAVGG
jgi:hypothetical protein